MGSGGSRGLQNRCFGAEASKGWFDSDTPPPTRTLLPVRLLLRVAAMHVLYLVIGILILLANGVDLVWTTIGTHGGGPLSRPLGTALWNAALALHRRTGSRHHLALSFVGPVILITTIAFWVCADWLGWVLVFSFSPASLADAHTHVPADLSGRIFYVAYSISTMGNGDYQPTSAAWRMVASFVTLSGIASLTLGVSFILSVLTAVVEKRTLGAMISDFGGTPERILANSYDGETFSNLSEPLMEVTGMVQLFAEQHLAYPVLRFFHSETTRAAAPLRLFALHETMLLLTQGLAPQLRFTPIRTEPLLAGLRALAHIFEEEGAVKGSNADVPQICDLDVLRTIGAPTVNDPEYRDAVGKASETRRCLWAAVIQDGRSWDEAVRNLPSER
jgi:hypothetical protein